MKKVYDLLAQEKLQLAISQEWVAIAAQHDYNAEKTMLLMEDAKKDVSFDFTVQSYRDYMDEIDKEQQLAYVARVNSCKMYRKYMKTRKRRERIVRATNVPRHGAR